MQGTHVLRNEGSVDEQVVEHGRETAAGEAPELRASVEQEIQGKVDTNHPDAGRSGLTLEAEERVKAREWEVERTHRRWDKRANSDREVRSRDVAAAGSRERRRKFERRRAGVDRWADPDRADPRAELSRGELGEVHEQASRLADEHGGLTQAAIARQLARRVARGMDLLDAVVEVIDLIRDEAGTVVPIDQVGQVDRGEVSVEGQVTTLWEPSSPKIRQVGLLEDDSGRIKFTSWVKSDKPMVREGERVRFRNAAKNWYEGRCSIALTGWSRVEFPERDRWWDA